MFNPKKAAFLLIAAVVGTQLIVVLASVCACLYVGLGGADMPQQCGDGRFNEILTSALAVGIALFGAGKSDN